MFFQSFDILHIALTLTFLIIAAGVLFLRYRKSADFSDKSANYSTKKHLRKIRIVSLGLSIILLATILLEPAGLFKKPGENAQGIDCIWALDVSASMDAEDAGNSEHTASRLARAKSIMENYMSAHPENRYGLIIFAGTARLVSPLTLESSSLLSFLASIDSKSIREGGTNFRDVLKLAIERFDAKENTPHAIVMLSDGGETEDAPDMSSIRALFQGKNTFLSTVGIGDTKAVPIPTGRSPFGDIVYKKFNGETVLTSLYEDTLKNLAKAGGGNYIQLSDIPSGLNSSFSSISRQTFANSGKNQLNGTIQLLIGLSFFFFLVFILLPSSFRKKGNAS